MLETPKYKIDELLQQLPVKDYSKALNVIPKLLKVSSATFKNWRTITLQDHQDIPHEKVALLEKLFGIEPGELQNFTVPEESISEILHGPASAGHAAKYGLQKSI